MADPLNFLQQFQGQNMFNQTPSVGGNKAFLQNFLQKSNPTTFGNMDFGFNNTPATQFTPLDMSTQFKDPTLDFNTPAAASDGLFDNVSGMDWINAGLGTAQTIAGLYGMKEQLDLSKDSLALNKEQFQEEKDFNQRKRDVANGIPTST